MKTGYIRFSLACLILWLTLTPAFAVGTLIATALSLTGMTATIVAFAINIAVSAIIAKAAAPSLYDNPSASRDPGNRQQLPPATNNKLPVVYGQAWVGGIAVDMALSNDSQWIYYVLALSEVTDNGNDTISFGDVYWGGKKCNFNANGYAVDSLTDPSTLVTDTSISGLMNVYLYRNGINGYINSPYSANIIMSGGGGSPTLMTNYSWNNTKKMTNCAFAIIQLKYSQKAGTTGMQSTKFQIINSRNAPGDCFFDYLTNTVYGAALTTSQIDTESLAELNNYCSGNYTYYPISGGTATQPRFQFDGMLDLNKSIMDNLQDMATCCDCLIKYNEITAQWGVIVQQPNYAVEMELNDGNLVSAIQITPLDISSSYNLIEAKFPDSDYQDAFNSYSFDLLQLRPDLTYPNEPVNKLSLALPLVNNNVRAQYIANRLLEAGREDLQISVKVNFSGIQLEAGDIVSITNTNYGWTAKLFRISKITEDFTSEGAVTASLLLSEFNSQVYDDYPVTQFTVAPNTGIPDPLVFGYIAPPTGFTFNPTGNIPNLSLYVTAPSQGITQYMEIWYSAYATPSDAQRVFATMSEAQPAGNPYAAGEVLPQITLSNIPAGDWYFFTRSVNSLGVSGFSSASSVVHWRPITQQFTTRYLGIAYADSQTGSGFSLSPRSKTYYGLRNQDTISVSAGDDPSTFKWFPASPTFGSAYSLCYVNYGNRKFSFSTSTTEPVGAYLFPTANLGQAIYYTQAYWSAIDDETNYIDLDAQTGRLLSVGSTTSNAQSGMLTVSHDGTGRVFYNLPPIFSDVDATGLKIITGGIITVDRYGRITGTAAPDPFYLTISNFTATSGQTVFSVSRASSYISGQCLVFENGCLIDPTSDGYTDSSGSTGTVTFSTGRLSGDKITIISMRSTNAAGTTTYASFSRNTISVTNTQTIIPSFTITDGSEFIFINGVQLSVDDYNIGTVLGTGQTSITDLPSAITGLVTVIQWSTNNIGTPNGTPVNAQIQTVSGTASYVFAYIANSLSIYENGIIQISGTDFTPVTGGYTLANTPIRNTDYLLQQSFNRAGAA